MLNSDKLVFVELQKTGSSGLKKFLGNIVGGESSGKTAMYAGELLSLGKPVVGLVCHPLMWYLDQWRQGCAGKGDLYKRLVDEKRWDLLRSRQTNRPTKIKEGGKADPKAIPPEWGAEHARTVWYADEGNVDAFHEWLRAVASSRGIRNLIDRGYQVSPVSNVAGLMTYHFVIRFLRDGENLERSVDTLEGLRAAIDDKVITSHFVRAEHAGEDLLKVLGALNVETTEEQQSKAQAFKRRGAETKLIRRYYDDVSLALVAEREALMLERFGYQIDVSPAGGKGGKKAKKQGSAASDAPTKPKKGEGKGVKNAGKVASGDAAPKLSKEERAKKREARAERQAAKAPNALPTAQESTAQVPLPEAGAKPKKAPKTAPADGEQKPVKVKRTKTRPVDDDVVENEA